MNEQDYRFLLDLYKIPNITRVAQLHYLSQPAMTKRIHRIEEELGCQLVLRSKKGIIFTPLGEATVQYCREMLELGERLKSSLSELQGVVGGTLSVGSSLNYSRYRLPLALKRYQERYPLVDINVSTGHSAVLYQMLLDNRISVAIIRGSHTWSEGSVRLSSEPICFVCNSENADRPLSEYPYIGHNSDAEVERLTTQWLIEQGLDPTPKLRIDDIASCREMAAAGVGWTIIPSICLEGFVGTVIPLHLLDGTALKRETHVLYRSSHTKLPQVNCFIDILAQTEEQFSKKPSIAVS